MQFFTADTISEAWENSLGSFFDRNLTTSFVSQRGACRELPDVVLSAPRTVTAESVSPLYPAHYKNLITSYADGFLNSEAGSTVANRLYKWRQKAKVGQFNQVSWVESQLKSAANSRFNVLGMWDPEIDASSNTPISPISSNFRVRQGRLNGTLVARSVDAWMGAFPLFVAYSRLIETIAQRASLTPGGITVLMYSYHIYHIDLPVVHSAVRSIGGE